MKDTRIYIIGAGAIGKTLAVFLQNAGRDITLLRGRTVNAPDRVAEIQVAMEGKTIIEKIKISSLHQHPVLEGIIVLTNKSYGNQGLAHVLKNRTRNSPIVILQNGLNIEKPFIEQGFREIYRAVLFATSQHLTDDTLTFKPVTASPIGIISGDAGKLSAIVHMLNNSFFEFKASEDLQPILWTKVIVNAIFNSVCPLLDADNGIFHRNELSLGIAKRIIAECIPVAALQKVVLQPADILDTLLRISAASSGQFISTHQDIVHKRPTEIYALNAAIVKIADDNQLGGQVNQTRLLGELVEIKSNLALK
jgi:2-dehydropantoate 2-reductase